VRSPKEIQNMIDHWESELKFHKYLMCPDVIWLTEETVRQLKEFKSIREKEAE